MNYISTSALASKLDMKPNYLFDKLKNLGWIKRKNDKWTLTELGKQQGGQLRNNPKFGEYVVWPENISIDNNQYNEKIKLINATAISKNFNISAQRLNLILAELGWIKKDIAGWKVTKFGKRFGGRQFEHETSGGTYVLWPESILKNINLTSVFQDIPHVSKSQNIQVEKEVQTQSSKNSFRNKFPATLRTKDGHMVRSRAEVIIDNALYDYKLAHAYERKLPIEEELYSDFFIPSENVYIEFWGLENDPQYIERKNRKKEIYNKYDFKLIELNNDDIANLDDFLPRKLLKFNIKVY